jgi:hypothetical protein
LGRFDVLLEHFKGLRADQRPAIDQKSGRASDT